MDSCLDRSDTDQATPKPPLSNAYSHHHPTRDHTFQPTHNLAKPRTSAPRNSAPPDFHSQTALYQTNSLDSLQVSRPHRPEHDPHHSTSYEHHLPT
ncbi:hypothetical protein WG66_011935 [Moniliophthora roreri]|nr:hypothetical protein WG66_011935 [Moniliophthora roreri]